MFYVPIFDTNIPLVLNLEYHIGLRKKYLTIGIEMSGCLFLCPSLLSMYMSKSMAMFESVSVFMYIFMLMRYENLNIWTFEHLNIWTFEHLNIWTVEHLNIWTFWTFELLNIWSSEHLSIWAFDHLNMCTWTYLQDIFLQWILASDCTNIGLSDIGIYVLLDVEIVSVPKSEKETLSPTKFSLISD
jgi:hypothetical protein